MRTDAHNWDEDSDEIVEDEFLEDEDADVLPCPACGAEVFDDSDQCPTCGEWIMPLAEAGRSRGWIVAVIVLMVILMVVLTVF